MGQPWGLDLTAGSREIVLGVPRTGKSTYAERLVSTAWRVVWFTPTDDYRAPGRLVVSVDELEEFPALLDDPHCRIVVEPKGEDSAELAAEVKRLVVLCRKARDLVLVLDEVGDYSKHADGLLKALFRKVRHHGLAVVLVSQVATDIPLTCRRVASRCVCFLQEHPAELTELAKVYGDAFAAQVASWRPFDPPAIWRSRGAPS